MNAPVLKLVGTTNCGLVDTTENTNTEVLPNRKPLNADSTDSQLIELVNEGHTNAFSALVLRYRDRVFSVVYNMTSNREDANDVTQDVFVKAFQNIHRFQQKSTFFTWLYRIAVNTTISFIKKNRNRQFFSLENFEEEGISGKLAEILSSRKHSRRELMLHELQEKLNEALQKLSVKHRTTVVLFEIEGLSHKDIGEILNCSEGTVRSRLHYAKNELQNYMKEYLRL
ncbi:MAG: sigma-70 family RNA polymerase sigma factor [Opitutae bacterium]|nr:sigma-70 family RNA polymerase sigma factor [Opitutae bacterium]MBT5378364.1 sigma-70 family RNA polymerase sigma factor [Opitutae bacterium]MBT5691059.1 sigma-70 family RNA polymerase sigma factor [Opitutae bacterium]MBT6462052.1 sigma-70 family RNA polymerase sigma factor [Opitutae bacterium]MBT6958792.1 sigma-70 family RNA polymerase sigma factor [Opitutae bacterium]